MFKGLFTRNKGGENGLKLKFSKEDNNWLVLKGHSIMFIGHEEQCKIYMNQFG